MSQGPSPTRSASPISTPGRCTAASPWRRSSAGSTSTTPRRWATSPPNSRSGSTGARVTLDGRDVSAEIREPRTSAAASRASVHPRVREAMVARQRLLIEAGRYVAEGRDIGTVVSPDSPLKVFLTASPQERARRRAAQTGEDGVRRSSPRSASATSATRAASTAPCGRPRTRSRSTPPASRWPRSSTGSSPSPASGDWHERPDRRRRRLPQRRQEHPGQPPRRRPRGRHPPRGRGDQGPQAGPAASGTASPSTCSTPAGSTSPTRASSPRTSAARPGSGSPRPTSSSSSSTGPPGSAPATPRSPRSCAAATARPWSSSTRSIAPGTST